MLLAIAARAEAFVYWANSGSTFNGTTLGRGNLDGSGVNQNFITGAHGPSGVVVDGAHIYWGNSGLSDGVGHGGIGRANLDGSGANQGLVLGGNPTGVAVDNTHVFWSDSNADTIGRSDLNGNGPNWTFMGPGLQGACGVSADSGHIYWAAQGGNSIGRANLDGTSPNPSFIPGASGPCGVAVDGAHVYWTNVGGTTIGRANLDDSSPDQNFITGISAPCGLAVDSGHIYWASRGGNAIGRANLDGSGVDRSFITGATAPCGVAVDSGLNSPTLATGASGGVALGGSVHDTAALAGGSAPKGTITFKLYGPGDATCSGAPVFTDTKTVSDNGSYGSAAYTPKAPGVYRWTASYGGDSANNPAASACNAADESVTVSPARPTLTTRASGAVSSGGRVSDAGTLAGGSSPRGTIMFRLYGPTDSGCSGRAVSTSEKSVSGNGSYRSADFTPRAVGRYRWTATYSGDSNNSSVSSPCNAAGESVSVSKATPGLKARSRRSIVLGHVLRVTAALTSGSRPTGRMVFRIYGPGDRRCSRRPVFHKTVGVSGDRTYRSPRFRPKRVGVYRLTVTYSGDADNRMVTRRCNAKGASLRVKPLPPLF